MRFLLPSLIAGFSTIPCLGAPEAVEIDRRSSAIALHERMEVLRDSKHEWEIGDILSDAVSGGFSRSDSGNDVFGFSRDAIWLKVVLRSVDAAPSDWFVELANPRIERVEWHLVRDGKAEPPVLSGIHRDTMPNLIRSRHPTLPLSLEPGETVELYLNIRSESRIRLPLNLYSSSAYAARDRRDELVYQLGFGAVAALFAAGLIFGLAVDFRGALHYSVGAFACGLFFFGLSGYWAMLELPFWRFGSRQGTNLLTHFMMLSLLLYIDNFFDLRTNFPRLSQRVRRAVLAGGAMLLAIPFVPFWPTVVLVEIEVALCGIFAVYVATVCARQGMVVAVYYLVAWAGFWLFTTFIGFSLWRSLPSLADPYPSLFLMVNLGLVTFLLSMGDRARRQRSERENARKEIADLQAASRERLEREVEERTRSLIEAKDQAERANEYKEMFLANISHEIRTPLSALISLAQAMHSQSRLCQLPPNFTRMLEQIRSGGKHLNLMLTNLLDVSSANAGKQTLRSEPFPLDQWSRLCRDILEPIATAKGLVLAWNDGALVGRILVADQMRLSQILINLVHNAVKFTKEGTVEVAFSIDGAIFSFEVRDEGPGLPAPAESLYDAFEQSLPVESDSTHGVGLGLYVVQSNVRLLQGEITSRAGQSGGTVFRVEFPSLLHAA